MIKNVIFDMGNVLIEWQPVKFLERMGLTNDEDIQTVLNNTVRMPQWHEYDLGHYSLDEVVEKSFARLPKHLRKVTETFIRDWPKYSYEIEGMVEYTHYLQDKGYKIYVLSNAGKNQPYYFKKYPYDYFDGKCISAHYGIAKPDKRFYEAICKKYNLKPEECAFTDDMKQNVEGAKKIGMTAFLFENTEKLKKDLQL